jgi:hypothetical protein
MGEGGEVGKGGLTPLHHPRPLYLRTTVFMDELPCKLPKAPFYDISFPFKQEEETMRRHF